MLALVTMLNVFAILAGLSALACDSHEIVYRTGVVGSQLYGTLRALQRIARCAERRSARDKQVRCNERQVKYEAVICRWRSDDVSQEARALGSSAGARSQRGRLAYGFNAIVTLNAR